MATEHMDSKDVDLAEEAPEHTLDTIDVMTAETVKVVPCICVYSYVHFSFVCISFRIIK